MPLPTAPPESPDRSAPTADGYTIRPYTADQWAAWENFIQQAPMATFLHQRRFLAYHGDRFDDRSVFVRDAKGQVSGCFPAAVDPADPTTITSHPGITYGGLLHGGELSGLRMLSALEALGDYYRRLGFTRLRYKAVPRIYHQRPAEDDLYALFRLGAIRVRCDLSCAIDLTHPGPRQERRRRGLQKARRAGIVVSMAQEHLPAFWDVLTDTLQRRHGATPVHTLLEMLDLQARFPDTIHSAVAIGASGAVVAGVVLFVTPTVVHAQYIAASPNGYAVHALDAVFDHGMAWAAGHGRRYFDFGISNEDQGRILNAGLYDFKAGFGATGVVHEFYDWEWPA